MKDENENLMAFEFMTCLLKENVKNGKDFEAAIKNSMNLFHDRILEMDNNYESLFILLKDTSILQIKSDKMIIHPPKVIFYNFIHSIECLISEQNPKKIDLTKLNKEVKDKISKMIRNQNG